MRHCVKTHCMMPLMSWMSDQRTKSSRRVHDHACHLLRLLGKFLLNELDIMCSSSSLSVHILSPKAARSNPMFHAMK
eukprot:1258183-Amphidinium_carterae.1